MDFFNPSGWSRQTSFAAGSACTGTGLSYEDNYFTAQQNFHWYDFTGMIQYSNKRNYKMMI